jgi:hypothetical protein
MGSSPRQAFDSWRSPHWWGASRHATRHLIYAGDFVLPLFAAGSRIVAGLESRSSPAASRRLLSSCQANPQANAGRGDRSCRPGWRSAVHHEGHWLRLAVLILCWNGLGRS